MPCQKAALAAGNDFFKRMFSNNSPWTENRSTKVDSSEKPIVEINIHGLNLDKDELYNYFKFLHPSNELDLRLNTDACMEIWKIAEYFQDQGLLQHIKKNATEKNIHITHIIKLSKVTDVFDEQIKEKISTIGGQTARTFNVFNHFRGS